MSADGQTAFATITYDGDTTYEVDETITVQLDAAPLRVSAANVPMPVVVASTRSPLFCVISLPVPVACVIAPPAFSVRVFAVKSLLPVSTMVLAAVPWFTSVMFFVPCAIAFCRATLMLPVCAASPIVIVPPLVI